MMIKKRKNLITHKTHKVKSGSLWPRYLLLTLMFFSLGFYSAYKFFDAGNVSETLLEMAKLEIQINENESQIAELELKVQMNKEVNDKLSEDIRAIQLENNELKEDILFYEKIVGKRKKYLGHKEPLFTLCVLCVIKFFLFLIIISRK